MPPVDTAAAPGASAAASVPAPAPAPAAASAPMPAVAPATDPAPAAEAADDTAPAAKPLINLLRGWPAPSLLPAALLSDAARRVLLDPGTAVPSLQYGPDPGYEPLREALAAYLGRLYHPADAPPGPARVCITGGASQNMACVLQSFTDPAYTARIWVVAPCYFLMCPVFADAGFAGRLRAVPEDDEGLSVAALERGLQAWAAEQAAEQATATAAPTYKAHLAPTRKVYRHVVYAVPASSNPSGRTMSLARRQALVRLARRYDALVVADDVYDMLQWPVHGMDGDVDSDSDGDVPLPPPLPRLVDVDRTLPHDDDTTKDPFGHAISNGTFSKLVGPGLRTGWVEATPAFVHGLAQTGSTRSGGAPSQLCAAVVDQLLRDGALDRHLRAVVRPALQRRHRRLARALAAGGLGALVEVVGGVAPPVFGGYFVWLRLRRADMRATAVAARARAAENLIVAPGTLFEVPGDEAAAPFDDHLRLSFSYEDEDRLEEGVARLARVLRSWDAAAVDVGAANDDAQAETFK